MLTSATNFFNGTYMISLYDDPFLDEFVFEPNKLYMPIFLLLYYLSLIHHSLTHNNLSFHEECKSSIEKQYVE